MKLVVEPRVQNQRLCKVIKKWEMASSNFALVIPHDCNNRHILFTKLVPKIPIVNSQCHY